MWFVSVEQLILKLLFIYLQQPYMLQLFSTFNIHRNSVLQMRYARTQCRRRDLHTWVRLTTLQDDILWHCSQSRYGTPPSASCFVSSGNIQNEICLELFYCVNDGQRCTLQSGVWSRWSLKTSGSVGENVLFETELWVLVSRWMRREKRKEKKCTSLVSCWLMGGMGTILSSLK